jgi:polyisoprenoid-binding protein YceI
MLKHTFLTTALALGLATTTSAADWKIDGAHSQIGFTVRHMVVAKVSGKFTQFEGMVTGFDGKKFDGASVTVTAKSASINTANENRDNHLRSDDFFAVEEHPEVRFVSTKVVPRGENSFQLVGDLTMRGVTKPVTFDCELNGVIQDPRGNTRAGFSAEAEINRQDFGVSWSQTMDAGGLVVSDKVQIQIEFELVQVQEG